MPDNTNDFDPSRKSVWTCNNCPCQYDHPDRGALLPNKMDLNEDNLQAEAREQVVAAIQERMELLQNSNAPLINKEMTNIPTASPAVAGYMLDWIIGIENGVIQTVMERRNKAMLMPQTTGSHP